MSHLDKADPILDFQLGRSVVPLDRKFAVDSANNTLRERREGVGMEEDPSKQNLLCSSRTRNRVCLPTSPAAPSNVNLFQLRH